MKSMQNTIESSSWKIKKLTAKIQDQDAEIEKKAQLVLKEQKEKLELQQKSKTLMDESEKLGDVRAQMQNDAKLIN